LFHNLYLNFQNESNESNYVTCYRKQSLIIFFGTGDKSFAEFLLEVENKKVFKHNTTGGVGAQQ
jgi:hypothetical protein